MNLLIVFAFAGDSTMTRFLAIAERPTLVGNAGIPRARYARARERCRLNRSGDDSTGFPRRAKVLRGVECQRCSDAEGHRFRAFHSATLHLSSQIRTDAQAAPMIPRLRAG